MPQEKRLLFFKKLKIYHKIIITFIILSTIIASGISFFYISKSTSTTKKQLLTKLENTSKYVSEYLIFVFSQDDYGQLKKLIDYIKNDEDFNSILLYDKENQLISKFPLDTPDNFKIEDLQRDQKIMCNNCYFIYHSLGEYGHFILSFSMKNIQEKIKHDIIISLIIMLISFIISIALGIIMSKALTNPINLLIKRMKDVAEGEADLTKRIHIDTQDEMGVLAGWINKFIERISVIITKVKEGAVEVNNASQEISNSIDYFTTTISDQEVSVTQTTSTLDGFTTIISDNKEQSSELESNLTEFNEEIQKKKMIIDNVTVAMEEISDSSKKIDSFINVINDISFQTNLLALNAAVEAARAGEAGRGFAVVASEVRNLAQKTAESSQAIQNIVSNNVESTVKGMELVEQTSTLFIQITELLENIVEKIKNISIASQQQKEGIGQINLAMRQIENTSKENVMNLDKLSKTSNNLKNNAFELQTVVDQFILD